MSTPAQRQRERNEAAARALGYTADFLSGVESREAREYSAEVAQFNRRVDLMRLGLHGTHLWAQRKLARRYAAEARGEMTAADERHALYGLAAELAAAERGYSQWLTRSRERVMDLTTIRELDVRQARDRMARVQNEQAAYLTAASNAQIAAEREVEATTRTRGLAVLAAQAQQLEAAGISAGQRRDVGAAAVMAGQARVGVAERAMRFGAEARIEARVEQVEQEIGAAAVSGAARGMRGSFRRTEALRAVREGARDLQLFTLEDGLKAARLGEERAQLGARGVGVHVAHEEERQRILVARAQRDADEARLIAQGRATQAGLDVRGVETTLREQTRQAEMGVLTAQESATAGARTATGEERLQARGQAEVREAGMSLREADGRAQQQQARRDRFAAGTRQKEADEEAWLGTMAIAINTYIRDSLPDLPDYEAQGTRAILGQVLSSAAAELD